MDVAYVYYEDLFKEDREDVRERIKESDRIVIISGNDVTINMDQVAFIVEKKNIVVFHIANKTKIVVKRNGEILYIPNDIASIVATDKEDNQMTVNTNPGE